MNATARDVADLNIRSVLTLEFQNLAADTLTWEASTDDPSGTGTIIPEVGQTAELLDPDGDRVFKGHVVLPSVGTSSVTVKVVGPWWWMERIALSGDLNDAVETSAERGSYVFPEQGLATSLGDLIDRAITKGVPMQAGTISTMFTVPRITLSNMSFAAALAELMRWVPDAVAWFDYSVSPPMLNITRRGDMTAINYTFGVNNIESVNIGPRLDLQVSRVSLKYVRRDATTGKPNWAAQNHGTAVDGKIQIITISGPEIATTLPKDDFDSVAIRTKSANFTVADWFALDPVLKSAVENYGAFLGNAGTINFPGWNRVISGQTVDWMRTDYAMKSKQIRVAAWVTGTYISANGLGKCANYLKSIGRLGWAVGGSSPTNTFNLYVDFTVDCINLSYPALTTVRKKLDYRYLSPPANLAQNLQGTQDWVPWEGEVTLATDQVSGYNGLQRKFNLLGGHSDHETMNALVRSVRYEIPRGRWTYSLGTPARTDYGSLVSRIRREPTDNIEWI